MGNSRGFWAIHHALQTNEARKDWAYIASKLHQAGRDDLVEKYNPGDEAGWRKIDKRIDVVCALMKWPKVYEMREVERNA